MKVAVLYSGQIRGDYIKNIARMKNVLPDADFFFGTWENQKDLDTAGLINKFYVEPKPHYNPAKSHNQKYLKIARAIRDGKLTRKDFPVRWQTKTDEEIKSELFATIKGRNKSWHHMKQHLGHAYMCRDFTRSKDYDIIIRVRYDCMPFYELKCFIKHLCEQVMLHGNPIGFHDNNRVKTLDHALKPKRMIENNRGYDLNDFIVMHRHDLFDPDRTINLYNRKFLSPAEGGWYQIMCEPYSLWGNTLSGFCRLDTQHGYQNGHFNEFKSNVHGLEDAKKIGDRSKKYNAEELVQESSSDVYLMYDQNVRD